jgi:hypothetical protein
MQRECPYLIVASGLGEMNEGNSPQNMATMPVAVVPVAQTRRQRTGKGTPAATVIVATSPETVVTLTAPPAATFRARHAFSRSAVSLGVTDDRWAAGLSRPGVCDSKRSGMLASRIVLRRGQTPPMSVEMMRKR